jgi:hypothetical protein
VKNIEPTRGVVSLHIVHELLEVISGEVLLGRNDKRERRHLADRLEVLVRLVGEVRIERDGRGVRTHLAHQDGVAIGLGAHGAGRAGGAAGARHVLNDHLLAERARHVVGDDARGNVGRAARRERHDQRDRARRIGLGPSDLGRHRKRGGSYCKSQKSTAFKDHSVSPLVACAGGLT